MVVGVSDFAMGLTRANRGKWEPGDDAAGQCGAHCNKLSIFKGVRLPFCAPRLIRGHFLLRSNFCEGAARGRRTRLPPMRQDHAGVNCNLRSLQTDSTRVDLKASGSKSNVQPLTCRNDVY